MNDLEARYMYACGTVCTNRRDYPSDLKRMKLAHGKVQTRQSANLDATMWGEKSVVSLLSTNTLPEPEIPVPVIQNGFFEPQKQTVSADAMKKPDVVTNITAIIHQGQLLRNVKLFAQFFSETGQC